MSCTVFDFFSSCPMPLSLLFCTSGSGSWCSSSHLAQTYLWLRSLQWHKLMARVGTPSGSCIVRFLLTLSSVIHLLLSYIILLLLRPTNVHQLQLQHELMAKVGSPSNQRTHTCAERPNSGCNFNFSLNHSQNTGLLPHRRDQRTHARFKRPSDGHTTHESD